MDTDIGSPEECIDLSSTASLCVPRGRTLPLVEHGGDVFTEDVTRGLVMDTAPRSPQIITFCAEKGPPTLYQDREKANTHSDTSDITNVEESLSYEDEAQHKVSQHVTDSGSLPRDIKCISFIFKVVEKIIHIESPRRTSGDSQHGFRYKLSPLCIARSSF